MCLHGDVKNISEDAKEWCRKYAPKGLKGLEDENFLLSLMYPAYLRHLEVERSLDYMVGSFWCIWLQISF